MSNLALNYLLRSAKKNAYFTMNNPKYFTQSSIEEIKSLLKKSEHIVIISHRNPDGDTIGSALALKHALKQWGKNVTCSCINPPPDYTLMLPGVWEYVNDFDLNKTDLLIAVDCGAHYLMKFNETKPEILNKKIPLLNIDHHPSNDYFGSHNLIWPEAAATTFIIYHLLIEFDLLITANIATCLMLGVYYDTGSLKHSNTTSEVLTMNADLLQKGARHEEVIKELFHTTPINRLKLWGRVMQRARINEKKVVVSAITEQDFIECNSEPEDLTGVIDFLNSIPESKFTVLLNEDRKGNIKGSFRTQNNDMDLSRIAAVFGGGGHKKASGFTLPGKIDQEIAWKIRSNALNLE
ncbi:MAG: MgpA protein, phosphoesterase RecJ domain-containing protein [Candidatus Peregrinibacteria bacterium GW2011_GWE2_39_6]|nr:MAG: MgpA protein, phosphoesterase RecJ domain-containing protein [Candidatus Peregrinibacteria bacterium GW2011_GWF2_39_17]KKR25796.1 MAG: MgpA protein, phosphoesterase RecJ domain-containing protein [Candidatus Peregrinibacteria bacterium GW2011_GWE2_39_6]